jgi:hypothetical protein
MIGVDVVNATAIDRRQRDVPLHIAAALGIPALGLFPPRRGVQPSRWQPIGARAEYLEEPGNCRPGKNPCLDNSAERGCRCMMAPKPAHVLERVLTFERWQITDQKKSTRSFGLRDHPVHR